MDKDNVSTVKRVVKNSVINKTPLDKVFFVNKYVTFQLPTQFQKGLRI